MIARIISAKSEGQAVSFCVNSVFRPELSDCTELVVTKRGWANNFGGTWLRPKLAVAFARWLSSVFAAWCYVQMDALALTSRRGYGLPVTVNPVADLGRSKRKWRTSAQDLIAGAFFVPAMSLYGGSAWDTFGCAGFSIFPGRPTRVLLPPSLAWPRTVAAPTKNGVSLMRTRNPLAHAAALRAIALAALRADSSLSVRLARYNAAMAKVRALEAQGVDHAAS